MTDYHYSDSKALPVQVSEATYEVEYESPRANTLVWLEDWSKHYNTEDNVQSAKNAGDSHQVEKSRTKYKVYRQDTDEQGRPDNVLTSDNKYVNIDIDAITTVAYLWDKPALRTLVGKVQSKMTPFAPENRYGALQQFILLCRQEKFPPKSLLIKLCNVRTQRKTFTYEAYVPSECYYLSHPTYQDSLMNAGYDQLYLINNKKTETCFQLMEYEKMKRSQMFNWGGKLLRTEDGQDIDYFQTIQTKLAPAIIHKKASVKLVVSHNAKGESHNLFVNRLQHKGWLTDLAKDPKRMAFKEELVMKVFHPDRVERLMGDTWGTEESWLNQI
jgi:hypothetical protein